MFLVPPPMLHQLVHQHLPGSSAGAAPRRIYIRRGGTSSGTSHRVAGHAFWIEHLVTSSRVPGFVFSFQEESPLKMSSPQCERCAFYQPEGIRSGTCRVRGPSLIAFPNDESESLWGHWPEVLASEWCGEFKLHDATDAAVAASGCDCDRLPEGSSTGDV